jgi:hypothetical protein
MPSTSIAIGALIWSIGATLQAATFDPAGLYVCRVLVGAGESRASSRWAGISRPLIRSSLPFVLTGEALFGQAIALYLSYFYKKQDLAKRVSFFIGAGALAGAFGGLISFGGE